MSGRNDLHTLQLFNTRLGLSRFCCFGFKAPDEVLNIGNSPLLLFKGGLLLQSTLRLLALVVRITASVDIKCLIVNFDRAITGRVDKISVVRHHK